jgi:Bacterial archaeo-eukaryotic release factor family 11
MHTDIPRRADIEALMAVRAPSCVTIYLPTTPVTRDAGGDRIAFKNQLAAASEQLRAGGAQASDLAGIDGGLDDLREDDEFWALQANSLAVFATPSHVHTYRLANRLPEVVRVSDRFEIKPLLRAVTFPHAAFVLLLAQGSARLLEITSGMPAFEVRVPDMPADAASAAGKSSIGDRSPSGRLQGSEGQKVRMRQYARQVDGALRGVLAGRDLPLILASTAPLDAIFRSVNSYPHLAEEGMQGNPEGSTDTDITEQARPVLDGIYERELRDVRDLASSRTSQERATTDLAEIARAATFAAVETLLIDIDAEVPGVMGEHSGAFSMPGSPDSHGLTDELARRVLTTGGRVLAVRGEDVPGGGPAAAILRYPLTALPAGP